MKKIKAEVNPVRKPQGRPMCPMHSTPMEYDASVLLWLCVFDGCRQVAFPADEAQKGRPHVGRGTLELVLTKDPEGDKRGRILLRAVENNTMIDVTDVLASMNTNLAMDGSLQARLELVIFHIVDTR